MFSLWILAFLVNGGVVALPNEKSEQGVLNSNSSRIYYIPLRVSTLGGNRLTATSRGNTGPRTINEVTQRRAWSLCNNR